MKLDHPTRIAFDHVADAAAKRAADELFRTFAPEKIPGDQLILAAAAFESAMRQMLFNTDTDCDHRALCRALIERWQETFAVVLRRLDRARKAQTPAA